MCPICNSTLSYNPYKDNFFCNSDWKHEFNYKLEENCPMCNAEGKNVFVNIPSHTLYGTCEDCFNEHIEPLRYKKEENKK
jgi:hypothetical protein